MLAVVAAAHTSACFRGDFLENTCEKLDNCGGATTIASTTGETTAPTTSGPATTTATTTGDTGGGSSDSTGLTRVELDAVAFRLNSLAIVDPDVYTHPIDNLQNCSNVRSTLSLLINTEFKVGNTNIVLMSLAYNGDDATTNYAMYQRPSCDVSAHECTLDPTETPMKLVAVNVDAGECEAIDTTVINPANVAELKTPVAPCLRTPQVSVPLKLSEGFEVNFTLLELVAGYVPDDQDPAGLDSAVLLGFIREEDAESLYYKFGNEEIILWSVISGSDHPESCGTANMFHNDVDTLDLDNDGVPETTGVWFYLNFTAERVKMYAPL